MKHSVRTSLFLLILFACPFACKKIPVPGESARGLFGKWQFVGSAGGWSGMSPCWPQDQSIWVEFRESGHYKKHEKGKMVHSEKFRLKEAPAGGLTVIDFDKSPDLDFQIKGDTLFTRTVGVADGCTFTFLRKE
jgi:hypothetical protein